MKYILVLDQGTTSSRVIIYDEKCNVVSMAQEEYKQIYPKPGYVEHDPMDILSSSRSVISVAITRAKIKLSEIATMGIANQRETIIAWNKETGEPLYNAIVWQCHRTADYCEKLKKDGYEKMIHEKTGLKIDPYFSGSKIKWLFDNVPSVSKLAKENKLCVGTVDTFLMFNLSNGKIFATDYTNASRTLLFNIHTLKWDEELCKLFNIPISCLPEVKPSGFYFGDTSVDIVGAKIPICGVAGDQQSSLFGQLCLKKSELKVTYGTGCFLLINTENKCIDSKHGLLSTLCCSLDDKPNYALEGSVFIGGAVIQWLRDELKIIKDVNDTEAIARSVNDTNGVVVVPSFVGLGAPYWEFNCTGIITGLTRGTNKSHLVRASLESIAYQVNDLVKAMEIDTGMNIKSVKVDGGASINNFLLKFQAGLLDLDLVRPVNIEVTSLGVCFLAGLTKGIFKSVEELKNLNPVGRIFKPQFTAEQREGLINLWKAAIKKALA